MVSAAKIAKDYLIFKAERERLKAEWAEKDEKLSAAMERIKAAALKFLNETDQKSANTSEGLIYWEEEVIPTGADWSAFYEWVREHNAFDFLHKRITATEVQAYMQQNDGAIPPGVSVFRQRVVRVRRNKDQ